MFWAKAGSLGCRVLLDLKYSKNLLITQVLRPGRLHDMKTSTQAKKMQARPGPWYNQMS